MTHNNQILQYLEKRHLDTNGSCGSSIVKISEDLDLSVTIVRTALLELYQENKISSKQGINGKVMFEKRLGMI